MAACRIAAGTDIACVGSWDAGLPPVKRSLEGEALNASAVRGEILPIHTSADGNYVLRILVEEPFVPPEEQRFVTLERELGLDLRSGRALVGGCEDFRNPRPQITSAGNEFRVVPSWYRARVHLNQTEGGLREALAHTEAEKSFTPEEHARYRQLGKQYNTGCSLQLAAVGLGIASAFIRGAAGLAGGAIAVLLLLVAALWRRRRLRGTDYDALHLRYLHAREMAWSPDVVLELHRVEGPLPGGSVELDEAPETRSSSGEKQTGG